MINQDDRKSQEEEISSNGQDGDFEEVISKSQKKNVRQHNWKIARKIIKSALRMLNQTQHNEMHLWEN